MSAHVNDVYVSDDPYSAVMSAGWRTAEIFRDHDGVTLTFVKDATSLYPGAVTKKVRGKDRNDAMWKFLAQLEEQ